MSKRQVRTDRISPRYEDLGIFKTALGKFPVQLVPLFAHNKRNDLLIKGYLDASSAIDVVFAGRRAAMADPLIVMLRTLWTEATRTAASTDEMPKVDEVFYSIRVEGVWRPRFELDEQGWQTRQHQLYAARWAVAGPDGKPEFFGEYPLK